MWGPEKLPSGSLGAYANIVLTQYDLTSQQTAQFLIHEIPAEALPAIRNVTYCQTAPLGSKPDSSEYYGALESVSWADKIEVKRREHSNDMGIVGATIGGLTGIAVQSTRVHSRAATAETASHAFSFQEIVLDTSIVYAPILVAGIVGAWVGKKLSPRVMKSAARRAVRRAKESQSSFEDEGNASSDVSLLLLPEEINRAAKPLTIADGHPEAIEELRLYETARRWANQRGCNDEEKYADLIVADMPIGEVNLLILQTKERLAELLADSNSTPHQDPKYINLLRDLQIAKAITNHRMEARNTLRKVGRGLGYASVLGYIGLVFSGLPENAELSEPLSYAGILGTLTAATFTFAVCGLTGGYALETQKDLLARRRSKQRVARELAKYND